MIRCWQVLLFCLLHVSCLRGQQTLYVLFAANPYTTDDIYRGCQMDRANTFDLFQAVDEIACAQGYDMRTELVDLPFEGDSVITFLRQFDPEQNDAVFYFYSGHGVQNLSGDIWPIQYFCPEPFNSGTVSTCGVSLADVHRYLKHSGVRLSVTLGSCCNDDPYQVSLPSTSPMHACDPKNAAGEALRGFDLLTRAQGHYIAAASRPGEKAFLTDSTGSQYVHALLNRLLDALSSNQPASWHEILAGDDAKCVL